MSRGVVEQKLNKIFCDYCGLDFIEYSDLKNETLTGMAIGLRGRDLLVLFLRIEQEFNITFIETDIEQGKFNRFIDILNLICKLKNVYI